jgi:hypothetical protein
MALIVKDRVRETTTTTGTGTLTLIAPVSGFQSFSVIGDGNQTYYSIVDVTTGAWEVGIGTYTSSGTTLSRTIVLESSNAGALVNFGSGTKDVFVTYPADRSVSQADIGTAPNEIPLNQYLGSMAYQNLENVIVGNLTVTGQLNALNGSQAGSFTWNSANTTPNSVNGLSQIVTGIHDMMRGCVLLDNGKVNYYLNPLNWAQKVDGTASVLTGADGQVMVEIPKFYYRTLRVGTVTTWSISAFAQSGYAVHPAFIKDAVEVDYRYYSAYDACLKFSRSVTAVADAGGGDITVTTSAQHPLYAGDVVTIAGTTSYDATYTVVSRPTTTTFTVTAAFVATETGTADGFVSGKNLDDMTANIAAGDELASVKGFYPLTGITRAEGRTLGAAVGTGWRQVDFTLWSAVQMLYLVEFQTFASQAVLGAGNTNGSYLASSVAQSDSPHTIAGAGDAIANGSTNTTTGAGVSAKPGTSFMKYRGIENFYGNIFNWADGINVNVTANGNVHVTNNATNWADDTSTNYDLVATGLPTASGFIRDLLPAEGYFLSSSNSGGSSTTYITDQHFASASSNRVVLVGGFAAVGAAAGAFCLDSLAASSFADRYIGARLAY